MWTCRRHPSLDILGRTTERNACWRARTHTHTLVKDHPGLPLTFSEDASCPCMDVVKHLKELRP